MKHEADNSPPTSVGKLPPYIHFISFSLFPRALFDALSFAQYLNVLPLVGLLHCLSKAASDWIRERTSSDI